MERHGGHPPPQGLVHLEGVVVLHVHVGNHVHVALSVTAEGDDVTDVAILFRLERAS